MRNRVKRPTAIATRRGERRVTDQERESALLAEFMRHDSVPSLASAIAERLGGNVRDKDLIARADLALGADDG